MNQTQMDAIQPHPTWTDNRQADWCGFSADLGGPGWLHAEVTWFDEPCKWGGLTYSKPELCIETKRLLENGNLETINQIVVELAEETAARLVSQEAKLILSEYSKTVEELTCGRY